MEIERKIMDATVVEKTWEIPAHNGKGPVTVAPRMPDVTVTDSEGRHIVTSPQQTDMVSSRMIDIGWWIDDCAGD
ncbi:MAG: hypothetical protein ACRDRO_00570 [Pseudonocardiaceae bacterium]